MKHLIPEQMHTVYGLYDPAVRRPFYIGCSGLLNERLAAHRRTHGDHIVARTLATFVSRRDALAYERELIARHRPTLNQQANPGKVKAAS